MKRIGSWPNQPSMWLTGPSVASICMVMPATMTIDRKCGRYETDCTNRFSARLRTSLSSSARTIGIGKQNTSVSPPSHRVLRNTCQNVGSVRNIST